MDAGKKRETSLFPDSPPLLAFPFESDSIGGKVAGRALTIVRAKASPLAASVAPLQPPMTLPLRKSMSIRPMFEAMTN